MTEISSDTTITGEYILEENARVEIKKGAVLILEGAATISGEIRGDESGVAIVAKKDFTLAESGVIGGAGNVQIVASADLLLKTDEEINAAFDEAGEDSGDGSRVGPIVPDSGSVSSARQWNPKSFTLAGRAAAIIARGGERKRHTRKEMSRTRE